MTPNEKSPAMRTIRITRLSLPVESTFPTNSEPSIDEAQCTVKQAVQVKKPVAFQFIPLTTGVDWDDASANPAWRNHL